jgi:hypothetical protein
LKAILTGGDWEKEVEIEDTIFPDGELEMAGPLSEEMVSQPVGVTLKTSRFHLQKVRGRVLVYRLIG